MIRKLRRRHYRIMIVLTCLTPLVFLLGLMNRETMPVITNFPSSLGPTPSDRDVVWYSEYDFGGVYVYLKTSVTDDVWSIDIEPEGELVYPDLLVYYSKDDDQPLLEGAFLLGNMAGSEQRRFALPASSIGEAGQIKFYSLAHRDLVATFDLPAAATSP